MQQESGPIRVTVSRDVVESEHLVDAVIVGESGVQQVFGDADAPVIPRSAIKPIQAIPLVRTGAADAFGLSSTELALAGASHSAEAAHVDAVRAWLGRIDLTEGALECGADRPISEAADDALLASGQSFEPIHNCCSGKHSGFLSVCRHLGFDPSDYIDRAHPVQQLVTEVTEEFTGLDLSEASSGRDGCGIPTFSMPTVTFAKAIQRLVRPVGMDAATVEACERIVYAYDQHPWWVSGTDRTETRFRPEASEPLLLKGGAEGVFVAALPERGVGIALKARDGAHRAAETAIGVLLEHLGVITDGSSRAEVRNKPGAVVGEMIGIIE
ncbi:MAG: asparaginase [Acidimicrobiales bacterium]